MIFDAIKEESHFGSRSPPPPPTPLHDKNEDNFGIIILYVKKSGSILGLIIAPSHTQEILKVGL
jgi:hypothetical protein